MSGKITDYVNIDVIANRPASPSANDRQIFGATDTAAISGWDGSGWHALGGGGSSTLAVATKTGAYTITSADDIILADATSGGFTIALPTAVGWTKRITVIKIDSSANAVTIGTTSSQTINGASTRVLNAQFVSTTMVSDNANWRVSEAVTPITSAFAQLSSNVTMTTVNTFYDGPTLSLPPGTYFVFAALSFTNSVAGVATLKLWDGTTAFASIGAFQPAAAGGWLAAALAGIVVVSTTATYKVSAAFNAVSSASILAAASANAAGNTADTIVAIKLA